MRHRFSTWKMTPVLGVVKADIFGNVSCNRPSWYKTYQLSGSHTVEALSPKKSICTQKAINFSIPTKIVVAARQSVKSQLHVGKQPTFFFLLHCRASTGHCRSTTGNPQKMWNASWLQNYHWPHPNKTNKQKTQTKTPKTPTRCWQATD